MKAFTKEKILASAQKLFVQYGFAGTSMGNIAKEAGVNHSLLFHHFGNKEQLWIAVKQNIVESASGRSKIVPDVSLPFTEFLKELFIRSIQFYRKNPEIVALINWQRIETKSDQQNDIGITLSANMQTWIAAFESYQKQGDINKEMNIGFFITMILGIISSAAMDPNVFISSEKKMDQFIDFCVNMLDNLAKK